jgi:CubicO group peptidase (beta-lactamase class C family)
MEYPASWDLDSQTSGFEKSAVGINGCAIDFAKFGELFLNGGSWNDRQVIPREWVLESTSPMPDDNRPYHPEGAAHWRADHGYAKYLWWGKIRQDGAYDYMAWGAQGEFILVSPTARAVVVRFGIDEGAVDSWPEVLLEVISRLEQVLSAAQPLAGADLASPDVKVGAILALGWPGGSVRGR